MKSVILPPGVRSDDELIRFRMNETAGYGVRAAPWYSITAGLNWRLFSTKQYHCLTQPAVYSGGGAMW